MASRKTIAARKARISSHMSCGHYVLVGQLIVRRAGRWICGECALAEAAETVGTTGRVTASR
jgi:hypothetical protein